MGNVPAKEGRSRSSTYSGTASDYATRTTRRRTTSLADLKKLRKLEEKDRLREKHWRDLVVRLHENVDGGFLAPYGTYKLNLDFDTDVVRRLVINRQLAPFYTPLNDFDPSWTSKELLVITSQLPLHSLEDAYSDGELEEDDVDKHKIHKSSNFYRRQEQKRKLKLLIEAAKEAQKEEEALLLQQKINVKEGGPISASLPSQDLLLRLYSNALECPICFLYYPSNLNISRCCLQPICTECFVQIKRLDPHPPHDDALNQPNGDSLPHTLISEPASCPYCAMTDFGVIYDLPNDLSTGINGKCSPSEYRRPDVDSNSTHSDVQPTPRPRRKSMAATDPGIVTVDMIRPDWEQKLSSAKSKLARKAAAASAIHASNLIIDGDDSQGSSSSRRARLESMGGRTYQTMEERMIEEALRLSLLDEEERQRKERNKLLGQ